MRPNIIICAAPKSGSSHIKLTLQRLLDYRSAYVVSDNVINPSGAQIVFDFDEQIFHHHIEATPCNINILRRWKDEVKVVVTVRNILDTLVSLKEYMEKDSVKDAWDAGPGQGGDNWYKLSDELKYKWIVYNSTPWYMKFYVMWHGANVPKLFVGYEDFFYDQVAGIRRILDFVGIQQSYSDSMISEIAGHRDGKFNKGRSGRGMEILSQDLIDVVYEFADSWGPYWGKRIREELLDG